MDDVAFVKPNLFVDWQLFAMAWRFGVFVRGFRFVRL